MRVALVHEPLFNMGGSERVLLALHALFPQAPVYTAIYPRRHLDPEFRTLDIQTSFMQHLPLVHRQYRTYLPLYPFAYERMDLRAYDVVISSSWSFAKGIVTRPDTLHICYCHNSMRVAWQFEDSAEREQLGPLPRTALPWFLPWLRSWDYTTASRVDHFVANSPAVAARIAKFYRRDSVVIPPPTDTSRFYPSSERDDAFLIVSRLVPYKRIDLAVRAFTMLGLPLNIIGAGREEQRLKRLAGKNVTFLGRLSDEQVRQHLARCRALIFPGEEDFGLTPVEAQASGRPVIAYGAGGALASVVEGATGMFFREQTPEALAEAVRTFRDERFDPMVIRRHAENFDTQVFMREFSEFVEARVAEHREQLRGLSQGYWSAGGALSGRQSIDGVPTAEGENVATDILPGVSPTRRPQ